MSDWGKTTSVSYKKWQNPEISVVRLRGEGQGIQGAPDEDWGSNHELCTSASQTSDWGGSQPDTPTGAEPAQVFYTVEDAVEAIGFGRFQWKLSVLTGLCWMADAMEMMILSILSPQLHCEWRLPGFQVAAITSVVFIGMMLASPLWGNAADMYGRRLAVVLCMVWTLFYGLLSAFAPVYGWILVLRGLVGFGLAGAPQSVTLYSEFLPTKTRATCIMLIEIFWAVGAVLEVVLAMLVMPVLGWRWLLGLSTIPLIIFLGFCYWLPESARYDVLVGNRQNAMATLSCIAEDNKKDLPQGILVAKEQEARGRIRDLFTPEYRRTTLLLWFIWFSYAFCYYGLVLLTTELFQAGDTCGVTQGAKVEPRCSLECNYLTLKDYVDLLWTTVAEFPGLLVTLFVIDRIGRRKSMALCFIMFSLFILPLFACTGRTALTIVIFIARAFIAGGFQVAFVYTPEVFPTETRALAMGICSGLGRVGALITPFVAQVLLRTSVYLCLSIYCGLSLLAAGASLALPIETTGRGMQESSPLTGWEDGVERSGQQYDSTDRQSFSDAGSSDHGGQAAKSAP